MQKILQTADKQDGIKFIKIQSPTLPFVTLIYLLTIMF